MGNNGKKKSRMNLSCLDCSSGGCWEPIETKMQENREFEAQGDEFHFLR